MSRPPVKGRQPLTVEQARQLLAATRDHRLHAMFVVLLVLGLRRSEALGLRWRDIDLTGRSLEVRHTLHREGGSLVLLPPKTCRSRPRSRCRRSSWMP